MITMKLLTCFIAIGLGASLLAGCDTTRNIYKSSNSKKDYLTVNAVTLTHCGCTHIYAESFKNGRREFAIFYNDNVARKTIFTYSPGSKTPATTHYLATADNNFTIRFSDLDSEIFSIIDSAIVKNQGIVYPVRRTIYKGFITDTLLRN